MVYNFEIADSHTYFVGKANGGAWVHNDCAAKLLPDFIGRTLSDVEQELANAGFVEKALTPGSTSPYRYFAHSDDSRVAIDTAKKLVKVMGPKQWASDMSRKFHPRFGPHNQPYIDDAP